MAGVAVSAILSHAVMGEMVWAKVGWGPGGGEGEKERSKAHLDGAFLSQGLGERENKEITGGSSRNVSEMAEKGDPHSLPGGKPLGAPRRRPTLYTPAGQHALSLPQVVVLVACAASINEALADLLCGVVIPTGKGAPAAAHLAGCKAIVWG